MSDLDATESAERGSPLRSLGILVMVLAVLGGLGFVGWNYVKDKLLPPPPDGCTIVIGEQSVYLTPTQAKYAAIIVGEGQRRGLPERAIMIALITAYQESGIRNIDYGDRDSLGLFQQRPSQGWGTPEQIMDPWYSSGKFYAGLVKVKNWQTMDPNDAAQKVQISAFPDAYRKHVPNATTIAAAMTGSAPASMTCRDTKAAAGDPAAASAFLTRAMPDRVKVAVQGIQLRFTSADPKDVWSAVHLLMGNTAETGLETAEVAGQTWSVSGKDPSVWTGTAGAASTEGTLTFRSATESDR